jgi:transcriptional regulator with XRE-family HTH domain
MNNKMLISVGVGERLREERERLGLNQTDFGDLIGVSRGTQKSYELGNGVPDLRYVQSLEEHDVDAGYVLTARRSPRPSLGLSPAEETLIEQLRSLPSSDQEAVHRIVSAMADVAARALK